MVVNFMQYVEAVTTTGQGHRMGRRREPRIEGLTGLAHTHRCCLCVGGGRGRGRVAPKLAVFEPRRHALPVQKLQLCDYNRGHAQAQAVSAVDPGLHPVPLMGEITATDDEQGESGRVTVGRRRMCVCVWGGWLHAVRVSGS